MLETVDLSASLSKSTYKDLTDDLDIQLGTLQRALVSAGIPLVIVFEGWDAAGKGTLINRLLRAWDPRGFYVHAMQAPNELERLFPPMRRFWLRLPALGEIAIFDRSWYRQVLRDRPDDDDEARRELSAAFQRIRAFERQQIDAGAVILKFWLHISKKEQAKRFKKLRDDPTLAWKVTKEDRKRHKRYDDETLHVEEMLRETSTAEAPWHLVPSTDRRYATVQIAETILAAGNAALQLHETPRTPAPVIEPNRRVSPLDQVDLDQALDRDAYDKKLDALQEELRRLEHLMYMQRVPAAVVYEGWDAAGKGGNIRRMTRELDPRGYEVVPVGPPQGAEKTHQYLWRFWRALPKAGHLHIFDRSWYGRVLVERVEGFATAEEWQRAYREINEFESELADYGMVLTKFWIHISKEEQLARFESRQATPHKQWKITEDDWRNREKWDAYWDAVSDMIERTSTPHAPWVIVEGNDKLHARVRTLEVVTERLGTVLR